MPSDQELARKSFEEDAAEYEKARLQSLDKSWVGLRVYISQDDGLWLFHDGHSCHPLFMTFKLDAEQIQITEATGLIRAGYKADRKLKPFQLDKLPYNFASELKNYLKGVYELTHEPEIMNEIGKNFDPVYRAVILFVTLKADKAREYAMESGHLKWFPMSEITQADEQDGAIIGMDDFHLRELARLG